MMLDIPMGEDFGTDRTYDSPMSSLDRLVDSLRRVPPIAADAGIGAAIFAIGTYEFITAYDPYPAGQRPAAIGLLAVAALGVALRRRWLGTACALLALTIIAAVVTDNGFPDGASTELIELGLLYTVSARCREANSLLALVAAFAMQFTALRHSLFSAPLIIFVFSMPIALAWFAGRTQARRRTISADLARSGQELEVERDRLVQSFVATERARIARELQALVWCGVRQMVADTRAARAQLADDRAGLADLIAKIEGTGRSTLGEIRKLLFLLRSPDGHPTIAMDGPSRPERSIDRGAEKDSLSQATPPITRRQRPGPGLGNGVRALFATLWLFDGLIVLALVAYQVVSSLWLGPLKSWVDVVLLGVVLGALLLRRVAPLPVLFAVACVIFIWNTFLRPDPSTADWAFIVAVYTVALLRGPIWGILALGVEVVAYAGVFGLPGSCSGLCLVSVMSWSTTFVFAVMAGLALRVGRRLNEELKEQIDVLRATRDERARRAAIGERSRIARDVHDLVAHGLTLMVIQAGAARRIAHNDPRRADRALDAAERAGNGAIDELNSLVGGLGFESPDAADTLTAGEPLSISSLVKRTMDTGIPIELVIRGEPGELDPGRDMSLYRIIQEALTNVRKHAPGARVSVVLTYTPGGVAVEVINSGAPRSSSEDLIPGAGQGLVGIVERAALFGGKAEAGPTSEGGFRLYASLFEEGALV